MELGKFKRKIAETSYRIKIRKALQNATLEELEITHQETLKEMAKRNKERTKKHG